jgi:hypothetical protein
MVNAIPAAAAAPPTPATAANFLIRTRRIMPSSTTDFMTGTNSSTVRVMISLTGRSMSA